MPGLALTAVGTLLQKQDDKAGTNKMILVTDVMGDTDGDVPGVGYSSEGSPEELTSRNWGKAPLMSGTVNSNGMGLLESTCLLGT